MAEIALHREFGQTDAGGLLQFMPICQKCGKDNPPGTAVCTECGTPFPKRKANFAGTMVGMPSPVGPGGPLGETTAPQPGTAQPPAAQPGARKAALAGTMIGMPSPVGSPAGQQPAPQQPAPGAQATPPQGSGDMALGKTVVGVGNPNAAAQPMAPAPGAHPAHGDPSPAKPPGNQTPTSDGEDAGGRKPLKPELKGTLLGIAQPGIAPDASKAPAPPSAAPFQGTLLGVAQPGIAPNPETSAAPNAPSTPVQAPVASAPSVDYSAPPAVPQRGRITPKQLALAGGAVLFAGLMGGALAVMGPQAATVTVEKFAIDEDGSDKLHLYCEECPDGSTLILDGAEATVKAQKATLTPREPLALGRNELEFQLKSGDDVAPTKPVILPIAFRVLTKWTGLDVIPPFAEVTVAAPDGSAVTIDGTKATISGEKAVQRVTFDQETVGEIAKMTQVEATLDIVVTVDGEPRKTKAELRNGVTPLTLSHPGPVHHLDGKPVTVSGQTSPNAKISIAGEKAEADDKGHFSITLDSPPTGQVTVHSVGTDLVGRRVELDFNKDAPVPEDAATKFSDFEIGSAVDLVANVIESRVAAGATRALLEVSAGCEAPPCLLRAVYAEPKKLAPNPNTRVTGVIVGGSPMTVRVRRFH